MKTPNTQFCTNVAVSTVAHPVSPAKWPQPHVVCF